MGSGVGEGIEAPLSALADLNELSGAALPVGVYRCIAAKAGSAYWEHLVIDPDGAIGFAEDELPENQAREAAEGLSPSLRSHHPA